MILPAIRAVSLWFDPATHAHRHSRESGKPDFPRMNWLKVWFPTFVGMTLRE